MNPNLEYAQFIPGVNTGRGIGLIETRGFTRLVEAIGLIASSHAWRDEDDRGLRAWFASLQVTSFALFLDRAPLAKQVLEQAKRKRIAA